MDTANNTYPSLQFTASELSAFTVSFDSFIISLKNGELIHFTPDNIENFHDWLTAHGVRDVHAAVKKKVVPPDAFPSEVSRGLFRRKSKI